MLPTCAEGIVSLDPYSALLLLEAKGHHFAGIEVVVWQVEFLEEGERVTVMGWQRLTNPTACSCGSLDSMLALLFCPSRVAQVFEDDDSVVPPAMDSLPSPKRRTSSCVSQRSQKTHHFLFLACSMMLQSNIVDAEALSFAQPVMCMHPDNIT